VVSGVWHGLYAGYWLFFVSSVGLYKFNLVGPIAIESTLFQPSNL
jgi:hypothetical protein